MMTTSNFSSWLKTADCSVIARSILSNGPNVSGYQQTPLYKLISEFLNINAEEIVNHDFAQTLQSNCGRHQHAVALIVKPCHLLMSYYVFGSSDDKYFLQNRNYVGYQDSPLYAGFYKKLQDIDAPPIEVNADSNDLWILPRAQYGHYIFDEVLPVLMAHFFLFQKPPKALAVLSSRPWQVDVVRSLSNLLFGIVPDLHIHQMTTSSSNLRLSGGMLAFPAYIPTYLEAARHIDNKLGQTRSCNLKGAAFLTREGFDQECSRRVTNVESLYEFLSKNDISIISPHEMSLEVLGERLSKVGIIISEPGTTPLLGYLASSPGSKFINMFSSRCLDQCTLAYAYSGWRYHIPWMRRVSHTIWGCAEVLSSNPFSDRCHYNMTCLERALDL